MPIFNYTQPGATSASPLSAVAGVGMAVAVRLLLLPLIRTSPRHACLYRSVLFFCVLFACLFFRVVFIFFSLRCVYFSCRARVMFVSSRHVCFLASCLFPQSCLFGDL